MSISKISSNEEYKKVNESSLSVIHFYAPWAEQCVQMNEVLEQMAKCDDFNDVKFANIIAEEFPEISSKHNISAVPTIIMFKMGNVAGRIDGANPSEVREQVKELRLDKKKLENLDHRLNKLINEAPCMLFMKGSRDAPRCGFSKSIIALLDTHEIEYKTFDILKDEVVREGLKTFSNWPTYPQLYINGELVGGLDIVKELSKTGELDEMVSKTSKTNEESLKNLINQAPCMLFMKGNKSSPLCGFSRAIVDILNQHKADYETFNILEDNDVREGLKKFINWPTYPQLYINGEFIGGLDIVKEMNESGDLEKVLPSKKTK